MPNIFNIFIILFFITFIQKDPYYNVNKKPSTWGIENYVEKNYQNIINEYESKVDSIYDVYIFAQDLRTEPDYDSSELARFYVPDYIYVTTEEHFVEYEFKNLTKSHQRNFTKTDNTIKGVIFHELTHVYFHQTILLMKANGEDVSPEYGLIRYFLNPTLQFGAEFIEEGFCEYVTEKLGEQLIQKLVFIPKNKDDFVNKDNFVDIKYRYSVIFLRDFMDKNGIKNGLKILLKNKPPSYDEIINPELYFNRLN